MKKSDPISKYELQHMLKNHSDNTHKTYLYGLNIFIEYLSFSLFPVTYLMTPDFP